ncbi:DUF4174 domain-containing protein [Belliella sp. DSM 107340]|uniref:DUF4174 domain-containing protein n=1 Tax=Belliella calami TaxID=2923436 RepID=A0ABS9UPL1_9BACT|nr:DUF4174 domain-containing protein [Belliella calami]MCH7398110.1 DUF4174 domain-containing protein [Belliella calami]
MGLLMFCFLMFDIQPQDTIRDLDHLRWKNRIVLYFPKENDSTYELPDSLMVEIEERKIVYFIFGEEIKSNRKVDFSGKYLDELISKYKMGSKKDCWVLIGLDGGVKLKEDSKLNWGKTMRKIDTMPMRIRDVRDNY